MLSCIMRKSLSEKELGSEKETWYCKKSKRKAMNRNWCNQKANPALNTKAGNK